MHISSKRNKMQHIKTKQHNFNSNLHFYSIFFIIGCSILCEFVALVGILSTKKNIYSNTVIIQNVFFKKIQFQNCVNVKYHFKEIQTKTIYYLFTFTCFYLPLSVRVIHNCDHTLRSHDCCCLWSFGNICFCYSWLLAFFVSNNNNNDILCACCFYHINLLFFIKKVKKGY